MVEAEQMLSDIILERVGHANVTPQSKIGRLLREGGPSRSGEFRRINNLPRRRWEEAPDLEKLVELLSEFLLTAAGDMELWPVQAAALREAHDFGGLFGPIAVGKGKALISLLVAVVMKATRPMLIVPAQLREQTNLSVLPDMAKHWRLHPELKIVGYTEISLAKNADILERVKPDLIIADECFVPDTLVALPQGESKRIEELQVGDPVISVTADGPTTKKVEALWSNSTGCILEIVLDGMEHEVIKTTENHPFYTPKGWMRAGDLGVGTSVVCVVQSASSENEAESFLFNELCGQVEDAPARNTGEGPHEGCCDEDIAQSQTSAQERQMGPPSRGVFKENEGEQPHEPGRDASEGVEHASTKGASSQATRRQWEINPRSASKISKRVGLGDRVSDMNGEKEGLGIPALLQGGHCESSNNGGGRGRRQLPYVADTTEARSEERSAAYSVRVARVARVQRQSVDPNGEDGRVYNIQVSGPGNFILAESGAVVHNCHRLKNKLAGRTKRVTRYMHDNPTTKFVALSGTVTNQSIKDYAHILRWCLKENTPLPESWRELCGWADVLDDGIDEEARPPAGALELWAIDGRNVRQGFRDRLVETHGVVATKEIELGVSLRILSRRPRFPVHVRAMLADMIATWETPGGEVITEAIDLWRHVRELCCGFYYRWDPPPPRWWLDPRKAWKRYVREILKHNRRKLDTELQVWNECADKHGRPKKPRIVDLSDAELAAGRELVAEVERANEEKLAKWKLELEAWREDVNPHHCEWCEWLVVKGRFEPNTVAKWVDDFALVDATNWLSTVGGIVWTEQVEFGEKLSAFSGVPYFGAGKKANVAIATHRGPCIASVRAHGEGKNLQHHSANLVITPSSSGKTWEQLLGRTHREGQLASEVTYEVNLHTEELLDSFRKAMSRAKYLEHTLGSRQKLLYADIGFRELL